MFGMNNCQDLVILIDVTASMKPCMEALKKNISSLIETLENLKKQIPNWRMMIAGYRDAVANPSNWFVQFPFTNDVNKLHANLDHSDMECKGVAMNQNRCLMPYINSQLTCPIQEMSMKLMASNGERI